MPVYMSGRRSSHICKDNVGMHGVSGFSGMGIVEWWNSGMVEQWNGGMDACVVSSTFFGACWQ